MVNVQPEGDVSPAKSGVGPGERSAAFPGSVEAIPIPPHNRKTQARRLIIVPQSLGPSSGVYIRMLDLAEAQPGASQFAQIWHEPPAADSFGEERCGVTAAACVD